MDEVNTTEWSQIISLCTVGTCRLPGKVKGLVRSNKINSGADVLLTIAVNRLKLEQLASVHVAGLNMKADFGTLCLKGPYSAHV